MWFWKKEDKKPEISDYSIQCIQRFDAEYRAIQAENRAYDAERLVDQLQKELDELKVGVHGIVDTDSV